MLEYMEKTEEGLREAEHLLETVLKVKTEVTSADMFQALQVAKQKKADFELIYQDAIQTYQKYTQRSPELRGKRLRNK